MKIATKEGDSHRTAQTHRRLLCPCLYQRPDRIQSRQSGAAGAGIRRKKRNLYPVGIRFSRTGGHLRSEGRQAPRIPTDDRPSQTETGSLLGDPGLEILPVCPQPGRINRI